MSEPGIWTPLPRDAVPDLPFLDDYLDHYAATRPEWEAAVDLGGRRLTHAVLRDLVRAMAGGLRRAGVGPGERVAVLSPPHTDAWISFLAAASVGAVWLGLNPRYTRDEYLHVVGDAEPVLVLARGRIGGRDYLEDLQAIRAAQPSIRCVHLLDGACGEFAGAAELFLADAQPVSARADPSEPCLLVYTSGTTGRPKGALLSQHGLIACSRVQAHHYGVEDGRTLNPLPINHVGSVCDTGTTMLVTGGAQVFSEVFDPGRLLTAFGPERITSWGGVPTMFQLMMAQPEFATADFSHLRRILWSGAPMPRPVAETLARLGLPMHNFYGMTETTGSICFTAPDAGMDELVDTIGFPERTYEVRIADPVTGRLTAVGETGEIQCRMPGVFRGYLNQPEATREALTPDGWLRTGDLAETGEDGLYRLRGRLREMFKSGGYNVYPLEVEGVLGGCPGVAAVAVVGAPDPVFHEVGHAFIAAVPGSGLSESQLLEHARARLANYKVPKHVTLLDELPRLAIGKVDRAALRQRAAGAQR